MEYTLIIGMVVAALTVMQFYMKRGIQQATKLAADQLVAQGSPDVVINVDKGAYLLNAHSVSQNKKGRWEYVGIKVSPQTDKRSSFAESTSSSSNAVYNAGEYNIEK